MSIELPTDPLQVVLRELSASGPPRVAIPRDVLRDLVKLVERLREERQELQGEVDDLEHRVNRRSEYLAEAFALAQRLRETAYRFADENDLDDPMHEVMALAVRLVGSLGGAGGR